MTTPLLEAANQLADILALENAALARMDLATAARMLPQKTAAAEAFVAAQSAVVPAPHASLRAAAARLQSLGADNRTLLERAIAVQNRVLGTLAQATRTAGVATGYGRTGTLSARPASAWALCSRA